ncbi:ribbon-helix-helix domain-containing protein [Floridanema evergladense]|uniref:CopG-like ribbon-helix-helix domain-containing protein n=1 Tax=Floridaenema evergladense BLCC-F167 TaxID=3153639 RepID=A0ABV4WSF9_9CYAN
MIVALENSAVGGKRKLEIVATYISKKQKQALEEWAKEEERSVSYILAKLVDKALEKRAAKKNQEEE